MTRARQRLCATLPIILLLAACGNDAETEAPPPIEQAAEEEEALETASACAPVTFEESRFTHCVADPERHRIRMALADEFGTIYRSLPAYAAGRPADDAPVAFVVNGGMFDDAGKPIGYYVEQGDRQQSLSRSDGPGNFHMKPNGVFYGQNSGGWSVLGSDDFYHGVTDRPDFGTQSGPMLVVDGNLHPEISEDGESRKIRNGVGVDEDGRAHFLISEEAVSFGKIARYFRDELNAPNALFLDGTVSQLWDPSTARLSLGANIGPLIVVENKAIAVP